MALIADYDIISILPRCVFQSCKQAAAAKLSSQLATIKCEAMAEIEMRSKQKDRIFSSVTSF